MIILITILITAGPGRAVRWYNWETLEKLDVDQASPLPWENNVTTEFVAKSAILV